MVIYITGTKLPRTASGGVVRNQGQPYFTSNGDVMSQETNLQSLLCRNLTVEEENPQGKRRNESQIVLRLSEDTWFS